MLQSKFSNERNRHSAEERARLSEDEFKKEFLGIPAGSHVSPFTFALFERATQTPVHRYTWDTLLPAIIAHDVGRSRDRSTAVVGGTSSFTPDLLALKQFEELPQGLFGSARAEALARLTDFMVPETVAIHYFPT